MGMFSYADLIRDLPSTAFDDSTGTYLLPPTNLAHSHVAKKCRTADLDVRIRVDLQPLDVTLTGAPVIGVLGLASTESELTINVSISDSDSYGGERWASGDLSFVLAQQGRGTNDLYVYPTISTPFRYLEIRIRAEARFSS